MQTLTEETGKHLAKVPRDILRYIWAFNHTFSIKKVIDRYAVCMVVKYADLPIRIPLRCLLEIPLKEDLAKIKRIRRSLSKNKPLHHDKYFGLSRVTVLQWRRRQKRFSIDSSVIHDFPPCLNEAFLNFLEERYSLSECDHCGKSVDKEADYLEPCELRRGRRCLDEELIKYDST